jgi:hypothetical protein
MKKNTVIRNDSPHAVKMREGSNVAERKVKKVAAVKEDEPKPSDNLIVKPTPVVKPTPAKAPKRSAAKPMPGIRLKTPPPAAAPVLPSPAVLPPETLTVAPILDEALLREQDTPLKSSYNSPHAVKMNEGSKVAERKVKKIPAVKDEAPQPNVNRIVKPAPVIKQAPAKAPKRTAAKPAPGIRLKTPPPAPATAPVLPSLPVIPPAAITAPPILDEASLWEQDNPVKSRLAQLRTRNALLDEQLQRLKSPFHARGNKS